MKTTFRSVAHWCGPSMSHMRRSLVLALAGSASACGGLPAAEDESITTAHELESTPAGGGCAETDLVASTCEGEWQYHEWNSCQLAGPARAGECLDEPVCSSFHSCAHESFGAGTPSLEAQEFESNRICEDDRDCFNACERENEAIATALEALRSQTPPTLRDQVRIASQTDTWLNATNEGRDCPIFCDREYRVYKRCDVTFELPTLATGQGEVCGCEQWHCTSSSCGATVEPHHSARGLSLAALGQAVPHLAHTPAPACSTCDPLPIDTPEAARAKVSCLESQRRAVGVAEAPALDARLRLLLTLAGDQLTPAERDIAWEGFAGDRLHAPLACEPPFTAAPVAAQDPDDVFAVCPASSLRVLQRDLAACERLAGVAEGSVRASVAWVLAERCIGLLERVHTARTFAGLDNACVDADFSARTRASAASVLRGAFDALVERGSLGAPDAASVAQYPELDRTLALVDRWYVAERASREEGGSSTAEAEALAALDEMLDAFWNAAQRARRVMLDLEALTATSNPSEAEVALELARAAARADRLDQDVLRAAHRPSGAVLAAVRAGEVEVLPALTLRNSATSGDVLLRLTGDTLTGLARALERSEPFHDLGCRVNGCGPLANAPGLARTPLSTLWRALAALDRPADGTDQEDLAGLLQSLPATAPWRPALLAIAENQAALLAAVDAATSEPQRVPLDAVAPLGLAPAVLRLAALVRQASGRARHYEATGLLALRGDRRIDANVSADGRRATLDALDAANAEFAEDVSRMESDRRDALVEALHRSGAERSLLAIQQRLQQLDTTVGRLNADALGLSAAMLSLDRGVGVAADRAAAVQDILDAGAFLQVGDTRRFVVHGHDGSPAIQVERQQLPIAQFAASGIELGSDGIRGIAVAANQQVLVSAAGEYSPLCSLSRHGNDRSRHLVAGIASSISLLSAEQELSLSLSPNPGTTIGPEGFQLLHQGSRTQVRSRDEDATDGGIIRGIVAAVTRSVPVVGSLMGGFLDQIDPVENSTGASQSDSVSFHGGLRLPETPFPSLPAGALLLLELPRGATDSSQIRAVHLVQRPATAFIVGADADLYFVVNDHWVPGDAGCEQLSPASDPNGVTVSVRLAMPSTEVAARSIGALNLVIESVRLRRAEFLRQGRVLSTQLSQLRLEALLELESSMGLELAGLPSVLRDLIEVYLARELSAIEIAVARQALARAAADATLEASAALRDLELQRSSARTASLATVWGLRSTGELNDGLQERGLLSSARALVARTAETLLPILELWHPGQLEVAKASSVFQRDALALASVVPELDPTTLVDETSRLIQRLRSAYESDPIPRLSSPPEQPVVGVSFRRPEQLGGPCSGCTESSSGLVEATPERSLAVWSAIESALRGDSAQAAIRCANDTDCVAAPGTRCAWESAEPRCVPAPTRVSFRVEASDIYRASGGRATLPCRLVTPVVQQWALLFANPADDDGLEQLSLSGRALEVRAGAKQTFVSEAGALDVAMTDQSSLASGISLLYARDEVAFQRFQTLANAGLLLGRNPVGLSPFSELSVDFAPLAALRNSSSDGLGEELDRRVSELILLLRLDARAFASTPPGHELEGIVTSCTPPLP